MISTQFETGQGLGNQLFRFAVTRAIAKRNHYDYGILDPQLFKGQHFMNLDFGVKPVEIKSYYHEKEVFNQYGKDISTADIEMLNIPDGTFITGTMQSVKYFDNISKEEICNWIHPREYFQIEDNYCIIHYRGGDYLGAGITLLPSQYYRDAMQYMKDINKDVQFLLVTDDPFSAIRSIPNLPIVGSSTTNEPDPLQAPHHIGKRIDIDYKILNCAKNLIISNSSFSWWAAYTNKKLENIIAPAYWSAYNYLDEFWSTAEMQVQGWKYLDKKGKIL